MSKSWKIALAIVAGLVLVIGIAGIILASRPPPDPVDTMTRTLDSVQKYLRDDGWQTTNVPRQNQGPGDLVMQDAQGRFSFRSRLGDCGSAIRLEPVEGGAALPSVDYSFEVKTDNALKVLKLANLSLGGTGASSLLVKPTRVEVWSIGSGAVRAAISGAWSEFRTLCWPDVKAGAWVVTEAIVARDLEIELRNQAGLMVALGLDDVGTKVSAEPSVTLSRSNRGTLKVENARLVFGFHAVPAIELVPPLKATLAPAPSPLVLAPAKPADLTLTLEGDTELRWKVRNYPADVLDIVPKLKLSGGTLTTLARSDALSVFLIPAGDEGTRLTRPEPAEQTIELVLSYTYDDGADEVWRDIVVPVRASATRMAAPPAPGDFESEDQLEIARAFYAAQHGKAPEALASTKSAIAKNERWADNRYVNEMLAAVALKDKAAAQDPIVKQQIVERGAPSCRSGTNSPFCLGEDQWQTIRTLVAADTLQKPKLEGLVKEDKVKPQSLDKVRQPEKWTPTAVAAEKRSRDKLKLE